MPASLIEPSAESLSAVLNHLPTPIVAARAIRDGVSGQISDFSFTVINSAFREWAGNPSATLPGSLWRTQFPDLAPTHLFDALVQVVTTGQPYRDDVSISRPEGPCWLDVSAQKMEDGIVVNLIDITHRRQAEHEFKQTNNLLETIIDGSINGMFALKALHSPNPETAQDDTVDFEVIRANPIAGRLLHLPYKTLNGRRFTELFPGLKQTNLLHEYARVSDTGVTFRTEQFYAHDGLNRWFTILVEPFSQGIILTFLDTTERKLAEEQLQQTNSALQATLDASISSILAMTALRDGQGRIVDFMMDKANRAVERSLGKTPAELEGRTLLSVYPGNVESGFFALYAKAADTGELQQTTQHYTDINGYEGWFEASAVRHAPDKIVLTFMNVTEYKRTEVLVRQQADLVQSVLNTTMNTVATYQAIRDPANRIVDFRFTMANKAALSVVDLPADELYTRTLLDVSPDLRGHDLFDQYVAVVQSGQPITMERHRQGRWFLGNAVPFGDDGLLTSSIDITSLKQAQLQIEKLNRQLQRSNDSLDQFAAIASHDLQEPLRKIKSFGDILLDQYAPRLGDGASLLGRMQAAADRMQALIRDLLAYSRLSKEQSVVFQSVDLNHIAGEVLTDLEVSISEKGAVVELGHLPTLTGDPLQLRQVIQNLLSNALKFTKPGRLPRVTVQARQLDGHALPDEVNLAPGPYWQITVADNGIGFNAKYRQQIFGAFERLHGKTSAYGGSGIGLAIVRKVMDNHQGAVTAQSTEGEGATFGLYFPASLT
ncbi:PAS domain-containing sensor histidine kinase [Spirosoma rigui]|uniref:PAS domain-containing sensor histidine kinase n=1 Tax=Spirosoma rigui TaxID=564064 RepID=UPI0009AFDA25|nr:PAS domain-containing protein [Spirosoma rigui]